MNKPYRTSKITSQSGLVFELHKGLAIELNSYSPYIFERIAAYFAIIGTSDTLLFNIGTTPISKGPASVTIKPNSISFGCQVWTGKDAATLRTWALSR